MPFTVTSTLVCCELIKAGYLHIDGPGDPVGFLLRVTCRFGVQLGFDRLHAAVSVLGMYLYVGYIICLWGWSPGRRHCGITVMNATYPIIRVVISANTYSIGRLRFFCLLGGEHAEMVARWRPQLESLLVGCLGIVRLLGK